MSEGIIIDAGAHYTVYIKLHGTCIKCWICGRKSFNEDDIKNKYCGHCHRYIGDDE